MGIPNRAHIKRVDTRYSHTAISTYRSSREWKYARLILSGFICNHQGMNGKHCDLKTDHDGDHSRKFWSRLKRKTVREFWTDTPKGD